MWRLRTIRRHALPNAWRHVQGSCLVFDVCGWRWGVERHHWRVLRLDQHMTLVIGQIYGCGMHSVSNSRFCDFQTNKRILYHPPDVLRRAQKQNIEDWFWKSSSCVTEAIPPQPMKFYDGNQTGCFKTQLFGCFKTQLQQNQLNFLTSCNLVTASHRIKSIIDHSQSRDLSCSILNQKLWRQEPDQSHLLQLKPKLVWVQNLKRFNPCNAIRKAL